MPLLTLTCSQSSAWLWVLLKNSADTHHRDFIWGLWHQLTSTCGLYYRRPSQPWMHPPKALPDMFSLEEAGLGLGKAMVCFIIKVESTNAHPKPKLMALIHFQRSWEEESEIIGALCLVSCCKLRGSFLVLRHTWSSANPSWALLQLLFACVLLHFHFLSDHKPFFLSSVASDVFLCLFLLLCWSSDVDSMLRCVYTSTHSAHILQEYPL